MNKNKGTVKDVPVSFRISRDMFIRLEHCIRYLECSKTSFFERMITFIHEKAKSREPEENFLLRNLLRDSEIYSSEDSMVQPKEAASSEVNRNG